MIRTHRSDIAGPVLALVASLIGGACWAADPEDEGAPAEPARHLALQTSTELTSRRAASVTIGATAAPFGDLDTSGIRVVLEGTGSFYHYSKSRPPFFEIDGSTIQPDILAGYEIDQDKFSVAAYVGFDRQTVNASAFDPINSTIGTKTGIGGRIEASYTPDELTTLDGTIDLDAANSAWRVDFKGTHRVYGDISVGPQFVAQGDIFYQQISAGAFMRGVKIYGLDVGVGAGMVIDDRQGPGAYMTIETEQRF